MGFSGELMATHVAAYDQVGSYLMKSLLQKHWSNLLKKPVRTPQVTDLPPVDDTLDLFVCEAEDDADTHGSMLHDSPPNKTRLFPGSVQSNSFCRFLFKVWRGICSLQRYGPRCFLSVE